MFEYDCYKIGNNPDKLVIFLHGYNGTLADHEYALSWLRQYLRNTWLIVPHAPEKSDKNPQKNQWFGMLKYDFQNIRSNPQTTVADIFAVYNNAAAEIDKRCRQINKFIDTLQKQYQITSEQTYLCGFSQGAMLTLYAALTRRNTLGGAFVLSGLVAGADKLSAKIISRPPLYLFHGQDDTKVQFKTLDTSIKWLQKHNVCVTVKTYAELAHRMSEQEMEYIADIINNNT